MDHVLNKTWSDMFSHKKRLNHFLFKRWYILVLKKCISVAGEMGGPFCSSIFENIFKSVYSMQATLCLPLCLNISSSVIRKVFWTRKATNRFWYFPNVRDYVSGRYKFTATNTAFFLRVLHYIQDKEPFSNVATLSISIKLSAIPFAFAAKPLRLIFFSIQFPILSRPLVSFLFFVFYSVLKLQCLPAVPVFSLHPRFHSLSWPCREHRG